MLKIGNSYYEIYYHVTFSTKYRMPLLNLGKIQCVREIAIQKSEDMDFLVHILNGYKDHIHILLAVPPRHALAHVISHIKGASSRAIPEVTWQTGYYVKTTDKDKFKVVYEYIKGQWEKHSDYV